MMGNNEMGEMEEIRNKKEERQECRAERGEEDQRGKGENEKEER